MQTLLFAAALSALSPGLSTTTTSYFNAAKLAQASGSPLLVIIEDPSSTSHRPIDLNALRSNNRPLEAQVCRIDANTQFGAKLAESYGVQSLPYAVITNGEGDIIYRGAAPVADGNNESQAPAGVPATERTEDIASEEPFAEVQLSDAIDRAKSSQRMLVVFVTTDACYYCAKMKQEALVDVEVRSAVADQYVSATIQAEDCQDLVSQHGIRMYPTTLILTNQGRLVDRIEGFVGAGQLLSRLEHASSNLVSQR